jgi:hypothetical protein
MDRHRSTDDAAATTVVKRQAAEAADRLDLDIGGAGRFLRVLAPDAADHCFQVFDDTGQDPSRARTLYGPLDLLARKLAQQNRHGCGVFVCVNEVLPGRRRLAENIVRVRALFADADVPERLHEVEAAIQRLGLPPSIVVESSPGKRHFYWRIDNCPLEAFAGAQKALAAALGTDPAVCDLPRVMRLPGFWHRKGKPFMTRLVSVS